MAILLADWVNGQSTGELCNSLADLYFERAAIKDKGVTEQEQVANLEKALIADLNAASGNAEKDAIEFHYAVILRTIWDVYKHGDKTASEIRRMVLDRCKVINGKISFHGL